MQGYGGGKDAKRIDEDKKRPAKAQRKLRRSRL